MSDRKRVRVTNPDHRLYEKTVEVIIEYEDYFCVKDLPVIYQILVQKEDCELIDAPPDPKQALEERIIDVLNSVEEELDSCCCTKDSGDGVPLIESVRALIAEMDGE